jgi:hypothetical protein
MPQTRDSRMSPAAVADIRCSSWTGSLLTASDIARPSTGQWGIFSRLSSGGRRIRTRDFRSRENVSSMPLPSRKLAGSRTRF